MPARDIAVAHQQDFVIRAEYDPAHAERHRPGEEDAQVAQRAVFSRSPIEAGMIRILRSRIRGCLSGQAILLPPGQWPRAPRLGGSPKGRSDELRHRPYHRSALSPAPMPGLADLRLKRVMGFINWKRDASGSTTWRCSSASSRICAPSVPIMSRSPEIWSISAWPLSSSAPHCGCRHWASRPTSASCPAITTPMCARPCRCLRRRSRHGRRATARRRARRPTLTSASAARSRLSA